jgi:hypothetical protein
MRRKLYFFGSFQLLIIYLSLIFILPPANVYSHETEEIEGIGPVLSEAATQYIDPLMPAFNANINSGWFYSIPGREEQKFTIEFGLSAIGTQIGLGYRNIDVLGRYYFPQSQAEEFTESIAEYPDIRSQVISKLVNEGVAISMNGGNIIEGNELITIHYGEDDMVNFAIEHEDYPFPVYVNLEAEPTVIEAGGALAGLSHLPGFSPQLKLGTLYGSQLILQASPPIKINDEVGSVHFLGLGVMHNPLIWFPETVPFQAAVGAMLQGFKLGKYVNLNTLSLAAMGGYKFEKDWISLTPQLGITADRSTLHFKYNETIEVPEGEDEIEVDMTLEQKMAMRTFIGLHTKMAFFNIFGRYYLSGQKGVAAGITLSF